MSFLDAALAAHLACSPSETPGRWGGWRRVVRCTGERAVVDFDPEGLTDAQREGFARLAERGVADLERLLGVPSERVRFVVSERVAMSRTFGRTVLLPLGRVRDRRAPYLHEAVHALLPTSSHSAWLSEGLACYLESWVAENVGGYDAHVFTRAGDRGIHEAARRHLRTEAGRAVLPWVGVPGEPPGMSGDRDTVARPFYVLAHSFTKYLVDRLGLDAVVRLSRETNPEGALRRQSGRSAEQWRADWLSASALSFIRELAPPGRA